MGKFDSKADEGIFLGYSLHGHAYRVYNRRIMLFEESMNIAFDETNQNMQESPKMDADDEVPNGKQIDIGLENKTEEASKLLEIQQIEQGIQSIEFGAGTEIINFGLPRVQKEVSTRRSLNHFCEHMAFVSQVEPKTVADVLEDCNWINAMHEELNQFGRNEVWTLVPRTEQMNIIGTKWVFKNKLDEQGVIMRNKARLVAENVLGSV